MQTRDRVGQQFGNYHLIRLIGRGGSAEVYLAEHIHINNLQHAIKVLTGTNLKDAQRTQFLEEARMIANLQRLSSHIIHIYNFDIQTSQNSADDGIPYLVMEYAAEGTLRQLYPPNKRMPLERISFYIKQIAEALDCAHEQNPPIVHRDIKPENMLLRSRDHVLLSDFGIAFSGYTSPLVTPLKEIEIAGTVAYMAPERFSNQTRRSSDQYALGVVVYEWLCGSLPFFGTNREILYKQLVVPPPSLCAKYPHITKEIENVVMRSLAKEPVDRYPTVLEFAQALDNAIQNALLRRPRKVQPPEQADLPTTNQHSLQQAEPPKVLSPLHQADLPLVQPFQERADLPTIQPVLHRAEPSLVQPLPHQVEVPLVQSRVQQADPPPVQVAQQRLELPRQIGPGQETLPPGPFSSIVEPAMPNAIALERSTTKPDIRNFFALSPQFARDQRFTLFRTSGLVLNVLSALIIGLLQANPFILTGGLIFSFGMFLLCIYVVEEKLALFFACMMALYSLFVGWSIGISLISLWKLDPNDLAFPLLLSALFFGTSLGLHIWYVLRKNP